MKRYRHYTRDRAVVLSCFGSIIEQKRYIELKELVQKEFTTCDVFISFSSRMVLKYLAKKDEKFKNLAQVLADVDMLGYRFISVASINLFPTEEHEFMKKIVKGFQSFSLSNIGYSDAILTKMKETSEFLKSLHVEVAKEDTANLYIIHGTPKLDVSGIESINYVSKYLEFLDERNFICSLEGAFAYDDIKDILKERIEQRGFKKVQVVPMLLVSGNHYIKDMIEIKEDLQDSFESSIVNLDGDSFNILALERTRKVVIKNIKESLVKMGLDV